MNKVLKIVLISISVIVLVIALNTIGAKVFNHSPIISIRKNIDGGTTDYLKSGLFVNYYHCVNGEEKTVYKKTKYSCPLEEKADSSLDNIYRNSLLEYDIHKLSNDYTFNDAKDDNYLAIGHDNIYNENNINIFLENYQKQKDAFLRIANVTIEGDLILTDLIYNSQEDLIYVVIDNTRDTFSKGEISFKTYQNLKVNDTNWVLTNDNDSYTIDSLYKNIACYKEQVGAYVTSEKIVPEEISIEKLVKDDLKNIKYSYGLKNSLGHIALIVNSPNKATMKEIEEVLNKKYSDLKKVELNDNFYIYVFNGDSKLDLSNLNNAC